MVGPVSVEPLFQGPSRNPERLLPGDRLDYLETQVTNRTWAYERFDLSDNFRVEALFEAPFLPFAPETAPGSSSIVSHNSSLTSTNSPVRVRRRLYSAICSCVWETAFAGMIVVTVLPLILRVSDQLGPWPREPSSAQWQFGLPHLRKRPIKEPGRRSPIAASASWISFRRFCNISGS